MPQKKQTNELDQNSEHPKQNQWVVYVLRCNDQSLYCGITNNPARRFAQHNNGTGARYTRCRTPVLVECCWPTENRSSALRLEAAFKKLRRSQKLSLLNTPYAPSHLLLPKRNKHPVPEKPS